MVLRQVDRLPELGNDLHYAMGFINFSACMVLTCSVAHLQGVLLSHRNLVGCQSV